MRRAPDHAAWWILGSNALAILAALRDDAGFLFLLWVFWIQSVVIGWYARQRMLALKRFSTEGLLVNDQPVLPTPATQRSTANFFALHYGGFHAAYLVFLLSGDTELVGSGSLSPLDWSLLLLTALSFWHSHRSSHHENVAADLARLPNVGSLMFLPYARVVPMHLAIGLGVKLGGEGALLGFGLLKTAADLLMHKVEHRWLQGARRERDPGGPTATAAAGLLLAGLLLLPSTSAAQGRELSWPSITVTATLDADGRLNVVERQEMRFTGDWNGGERRFSVRLGEEFFLRRIARLDTATGEFRDLRAGDLSRTDDFDWPEITTLRWRSRLPSDPPFDRTTLTYLLEFGYGNVVVPGDNGTYLLRHDFAVTDRNGAIDRFELTLTIDPAWSTPGEATRTFRATALEPGRGFIVEVPLRYAREGRPAAVLHGADPETRRALMFGIAAALLLMLLALLRREHRLGRFAPIIPAEQITKEWLDAHVFSRPPEVVGADWDDHTAAPEVAATLARLVQEKKLSSSVRTKAVWVFKQEILHLKLEVPRSQLQGHERTLVDALFGDRAETTDTERVRERYKSTGFDPAALIRDRLTQLVELTTPGPKGDKPSPLPTLLIVLGAAGLLVAGLVRRTHDLPVTFTTIGASLPAFFVASLFAYIWRRQVTGLFVRSIFWVVPLAGLLGAFAFLVLVEDRFRTGPLVMAGLSLWLLAITNSVMNSARSRQSAERIAVRKRLAAARNVFRRELATERPALRDEWFPWLIAFGLGHQVDRWFRAFGGVSAGSAAVISTGRASSGSSGSGGSSWTGFGGGGGFSGGGSSASFAAAVGGMASSVAAPSSSSSGGGGGGGGGGSSGGGGGGGW